MRALYADTKRFREITFHEYRDGGLWFIDYFSPTGKRYVPIECGKVAAETGLSFDDAGFTVTKFGVPLRYEYA